MITKDKEKLLKRAKDYAISQGGECLATEYFTTKTKTQWDCKKGHPIFTTDFQIIKRGSWCPLCAIEKNAQKSILTDGLERAKARADKEEGFCLSTEYKNAKEKMKWKCRKGHVWLSSYDNAVIKGRWCKICAYNKALEQKFDIEAEEYAASKGHGASCILPENREVKTATIITWICKNPKHPNHTSWQGSFHTVVQNKTWCPYCAGKFSQESYLQMAKEHARSKSKHSDCLSEKYIDQKSNLTWKCETHGIWEDAYRNVVSRDLWCRKCRDISTPEEYLEKAKEYAISKGGSCLSDKYVAQADKLIWHCKQHGNWESDYNNLVNNNRWCPTCFKEAQKAEMLQKAYNYAINLGGECLTKVLIDPNDKLEWKCHDEDHNKWKSSYRSVLGNKSWCPECGIYYQKENQTRKILEYLLDFKLNKANPIWNINPKTNCYLELDGYNEENQIAFEYQGRQHYQNKVFINANQSLEEIQFKDKIKAEHCKNNNVKLIIIDGRKRLDTSKKMLLHLQSLLEEYKVPYKKNVDLELVDKIYNDARSKGWDSKNKKRIK